MSSSNSHQPRNKSWEILSRPSHCQAFKKEVAHMLREGIIESSNSHWSNLRVLVPKRDRRLPLCNDFRTWTQQKHIGMLLLFQMQRKMPLALPVATGSTAFCLQVASAAFPRLINNLHFSNTSQFLASSLLGWQHHTLHYMGQSSVPYKSSTV